MIEMLSNSTFYIFINKYIKINKTACMINFNIIFLPKILMDIKSVYFVLLA